MTDGDPTDPDSDTLSFEMEIAPAKAPTPTRVAGNTEVTLSWTEPDDAGIGGWELSRDGGSWGGIVPTEMTGNGTTRLSYRVTSLGNGTEYGFRIRAHAGSGGDRIFGAASDSVAATPVAEKPARPTGLTASGGDGEVTLSWTAGGDGGSAVTGHEYLHREGTADYGDEWTGIANSAPGEANATSFTVTGLTNGTDYSFKVRAVNSAGEGAESNEASATPSAVNRAPVFGADTATRSVAENTATGTDIGDAVTATDADGDTLTYSLGGTDVASFAIVAASGQLQTEAALNFETRSSYEVTVTATDTSGGTDSITVTISVTNVDEAGSVSFSSTAPQVGTALTASVSDPDGGETGTTWQWSSASTSGGTFTAISGATNAAHTPASTDVGNYLEATASYEDAQGAGKTASRVTASAVAAHTEPVAANTAPVIAGGAMVALEVAENTTGEIGTFTATDAEGDPIEWSLAGDDAESFAIDVSSGAVSVGSGTTLDYESGAIRYGFTVKADDGSLSNTVSVSVTVTDVGEAPRAPSAPEVTAVSATSLEVSWSEPGNSGPAIDGYDVRYREGASEGWTALAHSGVGTGATIAGLTAGASHEVQVRARNAEGGGGWSASGGGTTFTAAIVAAPAGVTVTEASGDGRAATYMVNLGSRPGGEVTVNLAGNDAAVAVVSPASLSFTADDWDMGQAVTVTGVDDAIDNDGRSTAIAHTATGGGYDNADAVTVTVTLIDDESAPTVSLGSASAAEGDGGVSALVFDVALSPASASEVTVEWATADGTAVAGEDYEAATGTLTFAPGETAGTIGVRVLGDESPEGDEQFRVMLSDARGAALGEATAAGTIVDDDADDARGRALTGVLAGLGRTLASDAVAAIGGRLESASRVGCDSGGGWRSEGSAFAGWDATPWADRSGDADSRWQSGEGFGATHDLESGSARLSGGDPDRAVSLPPPGLEGRTGAGAGGGSGGDLDQFVSLLPGMLDGRGGLGGLASRLSRSLEERDGVSRLVSLLPRSFEGRVGGGSAQGSGDEDCSGGFGVWGRITDSGFGAGADRYSSDGKLTTGYFGVDRRVGDRLLLGVMVSHAIGDTSFSSAGAANFQGEVDTSLTAVMPYGRMSLGSGSVWGLLGRGSGEVETMDALDRAAADLSMGVAALGARWELDSEGWGRHGVRGQGRRVRDTAVGGGGGRFAAGIGGGRAAAPAAAGRQHGSVGAGSREHPAARGGRWPLGRRGRGRRRRP